MKLVSSNSISNSANNCSQQVVEGELQYNGDIIRNRVQLGADNQPETSSMPLDSNALLSYLNKEEGNAPCRKECSSVLEAMNSMYALCTSVTHFQNNKDFSKPKHQKQITE